MSGPRRIGVLGGMGPEATVLFMQRLIAATPVHDDRDHIPLIVDSNTQVPSRITALVEGKGADPAPVLARMARGLEAAGAEALAMPCNTAHHYAPVIAAATHLPLLDMVELSAERAATAVGPGGRVGLLASPAAKLTGLFDEAFAKRGLTAAYPADQEALLAAIKRIKISGRNSASLAVLQSAASELTRTGVGVQLIACSEFSLIADAVTGSAEVIDTLDVLVEHVVRFATGYSDEGVSAATG